MFAKQEPVNVSTLSPLSRGLAQQHEQRQQPALMPMLQPRPLASAQQGFTFFPSFGSASAVAAPAPSQRQLTPSMPNAANVLEPHPQPLPLPPQPQLALPSCHTPQDSYLVQPTYNAQHQQPQLHSVGKGVPPGPVPPPQPATSSPAPLAAGTWAAGIKTADMKTADIKTADSSHSSHASNVNIPALAARAAPAGPPTPRQQAPPTPQHSFPSSLPLPIPHPPAPVATPQQHDQVQPVPPVLELQQPTTSSISPIGPHSQSSSSHPSCSSTPAPHAGPACQPSTSPMSSPAEPTPTEHVYLTRAAGAPEPAVPGVPSTPAPGPMGQEQREQQQPCQVGVL